MTRKRKNALCCKILKYTRIYAYNMCKGGSISFYYTIGFLSLDIRDSIYQIKPYFCRCWCGNENALSWIFVCVYVELYYLNRLNNRNEHVKLVSVLCFLSSKSSYPLTGFNRMLHLLGLINTICFLYLPQVWSTWNKHVRQRSFVNI